jgi:O-antigen ligase
LSLASAAAAPARPRWNWAAGRKIGDFALGGIVFLGGFVIDEPAPYELLLLPLILVWSVFGLTLNRHFAPMAVLLLVYVTGGLLSLTQLPDPTDGAIYAATTAFLALSSIFFAAVIAVEPERRLAVVRKAYIAAAAIAAVLGLAGYFHLFPGAEIFTRYGRLKGTFQDPNVFAPFMVLPITLLFRDVLTSRLRASPGKIALILLLLLAVFLSFSRAAWGMTAFAILLVAAFTYFNETRAVARLRIVTYFAIGLILVAVLLVAVLSIPAVGDLFSQRAELVEDYDAGQFGRFGRHILGFFLVQEHPLGIGPLVFSTLFGEDEHNMWLKGFTTYGWLGGFAYIILVLWTIVASARILFKPRPWQAALHCIFAVYLGQVMIHNVIDNDHWRHLFLLYGLLWGLIAADKIYSRAARQSASLTPAAAR